MNREKPASFEELRQEARSVSTLIGDALNQFTKLLQNEIDLAKAEAGEKVRQLTTAAALFACGALFVIPAIVMALFALSAALIANGWPTAAAYLVSALIAGVLAALMVVLGMRKMDPGAGSETMRQLDKDKQAIKGFVR